jgi:multiple sugar transport system permease protein
VIYIVLSSGMVLMVFPYVWMVLSSIKVGEEIFTRFFPTRITWQNYIDLATGTRSFSPIPIWRNFINSIIVATVPAVSVMVIGAITGYALAKLPFRGKGLLTNWVLAQMTIPFTLFLIPLFMIVMRLKSMNTYQGMFLPFLTGPVSVFLFAQFFRTIPEDLLDSARIDGVSELGIVFRIMMPLATGVAAIVGLFTFMGRWNDFLWYLIISRDWTIMPLSVVLGGSSTVYRGADFARLMALSTVMTLPILILFLVARRFFVEGIALTGLKL